MKRMLFPFLFCALLLGGCSLYQKMIPGNGGPQRPTRYLKRHLAELVDRTDIILNGEGATRVAVLEITAPDGTVSNLGRYLSGHLADNLGTKQRPALRGYPEATPAPVTPDTLTVADTTAAKPVPIPQKPARTVIISGSLEDHKTLYQLHLTFTDFADHTPLGTMTFDLPEEPYLRCVEDGLDVADADEVRVRAADQRFAGTWLLCRSERGVTRKMHLVLTQNLNAVDGTYDWYDGSVTGRVEGDKLILQWYQGGNRQAGEGYLVINAEGTRLKGKWGTSPARPSRKWEAVRVE